MMFNDLKWDWKTFGFTNPMDFALPALDWWVETGIAPLQIIASHLTASGKVDCTRPLCMYPQVEQYKGSGSIDDVANFICANPK